MENHEKQNELRKRELALQVFYVDVEKAIHRLYETIGKPEAKYEKSRDYPCGD